MPQVYWVEANNPAEQLEKSFLEYQRFIIDLPYIPTGAAYYEDGWKPTTAEIQEFITACHSHGWNYNFWEMYDALFVAPEFWPVIAGGITIPSLDRVRVSYAYGLNIRSAPVIATNIIGGAYYGSIWTALGRVKDALGREWVQIGPSAFIAGWYTTRI
jgi:hypothetical protein